MRGTNFDPACVAGYQTTKMENCVEIHSSVTRLISHLQREGCDNLAGFLVGQENDDKITVVACARCQSLTDSNVEETAKSLQSWIPGGIVLCGLFYTAKTEPSSDTVINEVKKYDSLLKHVTSNERVVCHLMKDGGQISKESFYLLTEKGSPSSTEVKITDRNILQDSLIARAQCMINITFSAGENVWKASLHERLSKLSEDLMSQSTMFHLPNSPILLGTDKCSGVTLETTCRDLYYKAKDSENGGLGKKKKYDKIQFGLTFDIYTDVTHECSQRRAPTCAPVINSDWEQTKTVRITLPLDVIAVVSLDSTIEQLSDQLCNALVHQVAAMETNICQFHKGDTFYTAEPYHYQLSNLQTLITILHPRGLTEDQLVNHRRSVQQILCLPTDRPMCRRDNRFILPEERLSQGYLFNVHEGLSPSKVKEGKQYIVDGFYTYHHYMQDRFDDNKWGCAYRSLQTLVSWFKLQGYTSTNIPSHKEIQQALVDIGDKEPNFVGSRKWIGSMEVSFCLDHLIGVTSKILSVSTGAELSSKGRELAAHFSTQGTPIMIGGGVLAHTILGVDYDEVSGDINFLILDPHYTGAEDLKTIHDKGWCGWKGPDFWDKHAHYNMCLPQRPNMI